MPRSRLIRFFFLILFCQMSHLCILKSFLFNYTGKNTYVLSIFKLSHLHRMPFPKMDDRQNFKNFTLYMHDRVKKNCIDHLSSLDGFTTFHSEQINA